MGGREGEAAKMTDKPTVDEAWNAVMCAVRSVAKGDYNQAQGFRFRGVDAVVDATGPALREHGVAVIPKEIKEITRAEYETRKRDNTPGTRMINTTVTVVWEVRGPGGDTFTGESAGEAADAGDKSISKAQSVAYRVFLLQALNIPTGEMDPDAESHERAAASTSRQRTASTSRQGGDTGGADHPPAPARPRSTNQDALDELTSICNENGYDLREVADRYRKEHGLPVGHAAPDRIRAFALTLIEEAEPSGEPADPEPRADSAAVGGTQIPDDVAESGHTPGEEFIF
jgi:hypothetical protein